MKRRRSRPSGSTPTGRAAPAKPESAKAPRKRWMVGVCSFDGRSTKSPTRVTAPAFATPPFNSISTLAIMTCRRHGHASSTVPATESNQRPTGGCRLGQPGLTLRLRGPHHLFQPRSCRPRSASFAQLGPLPAWLALPLPSWLDVPAPSPVSLRGVVSRRTACSDRLLGPRCPGTDVWPSVPVEEHPATTSATATSAPR